MPGSPILSVRGLVKTFDVAGHPLHVLREATFDLDPGDSCAIVGPSGSGKSTLLGLCAGLDLPSAGTIHLDGQDLFALDEETRARLRSRLVGFIFQAFQLLPTLTALENVMVPGELQGNRRCHDRAADLLGQVGLADRLDHYPQQLSGGEQQRVAIARAFMNAPAILFADEPTGNLDAETGQVVIDMLFALNEAHHTTLVLVTHDADLAARAKRIIRLKNGEILPDQP